MPKMSEADLGDLIGRRRDASLKHLDDVRSKDRREALQFYRGDNLSLYGNSGDGLSTVVSRDLLEAIESMLPGLVKPFIAGDEMVRFEPTGPEDEEPAKQATEYINYLFQNHNDAVRVVYDFTKDGLLYRLGIAKVVYETVADECLETYKGLDELQVLALSADDSHEIVGDVTQAEDGTFEVRCSHTEERPMFRVYIVAPDEFLFEHRLASLDEGRFFAHRGTKPVGDWIAMGLPKAKVKALKSGDRNDKDADDRFDYEDRRDDGDNDDDLARLVTVDECYIRCDYDGNGTLGWRKVFIGANGNDILLNEEADDHPYCCWTPIPVPHKLVGMSIFDLVRDLQMQGTAILRETLNALYLANRPQREVVEGQVNFEDLLNPEVGGFVRVKQPGMVREIETGGEGVITNSLAMMEQIASIREQRTGSTRYNQGMDADSLNKTATGISIIQNASTQRQELIARHLAEGMKAIFKKLLGLVCRHLDKKEIIRLRGEWVEMDPKDWKEGYDMSVAVGLGTGNKEQMVAHLTDLMGVQAQIAQAQGGMDGPILTWENVFETTKRYVEALGLKGAERYFKDPAPKEGQPEQPQPDPAQAAQDQQMQAEVMKFQAESELEMKKAQLDSETKIEIAHINAEKDLLIAGLNAPPELHAGGMNGMAQEAPQNPPEQQEPPEAPMMPEQPGEMPDAPYTPADAPPDMGDNMGMMPPEMGQ
jgi:hypothetical protein